MSSAHNIQIMHGSECDIHIWRTRGRKCCTTAQPKCDIFNRGSSYLHAARTATAAVDRSISPGRSAANPPAAIAAVDRQYRQTDRWTDGRTSERYVDSYVGNVKHELDRLVLVTNCSCANDTNHHTSRHVALLITPSFSYLHKICSQKNRQKYSWRANTTALRYKYQQRKFYK